MHSTSDGIYHEILEVVGWNDFTVDSNNVNSSSFIMSLLLPLVGLAHSLTRPVISLDWGRLSGKEWRNPLTSGAAENTTYNYTYKLIFHKLITTLITSLKLLATAEEEKLLYCRSIYSSVPFYRMAQERNI